MAWGRKKRGGRREPQFGLGASLAELRLGPQDRVTATDDKAKKSSSRRTASDDDEDDAPREPRQKGKRLGRPKSVFDRSELWNCASRDGVSRRSLGS